MQRERTGRPGPAKKWRMEKATPGQKRKGVARPDEKKPDSRVKEGKVGVSRPRLGGRKARPGQKGQEGKARRKRGIGKARPRRKRKGWGRKGMQNWSFQAPPWREIGRPGPAKRKGEGEARQKEREGPGPMQRERNRKARPRPKSEGWEGQAPAKKNDIHMFQIF